MAGVASQKSQAAVCASLVSENTDKIRNLLAIKSQAAIPALLVSNESANKVRNLLATIDNARAAKKANTYVSTAAARIALVDLCSQAHEAH
jgi:hypothetical protein